MDARGDSGHNFVAYRHPGHFSRRQLERNKICNLPHLRKNDCLGPGDFVARRSTALPKLGLRFGPTP